MYHTYLGTITNTYMMRGYGISFVYEVLLPEVGSNIFHIFHLFNLVFALTYSSILGWKTMNL